MESDSASSLNKLFFTRTLMPGFSEKLEIPSAFSGHMVPGSIAKIRDPLGFQWPITVQGDAPNVCFGEGWQRFTKVYKLEVGDVLIFCYEGDRTFRIIIFGKNLYRKEYCLEFQDKKWKAVEEKLCQDATDNGHDSKHKDTDLQMLDEVNDMEKNDVDDKCRITPAVFDGTCKDKIRKVIEDPEDTTGRTTANKKRMMEDSHEEVTGHKRVKIEHADSLDIMNDNKVIDRVEEKKMNEKKDKAISSVLVVENDRNEQSSEGESNPQNLPLVETVNGEDAFISTSVSHENIYICKEQTHHKDIDSDGTISPNFRITLKPNNLDGHFYLTVPVKFKIDAGLQKTRTVILRNSEGQDWKTELHHSTKNRTLLSRGWREFCIHNKPRPGDDCEFQLCPEKNKDTKIIQVSIIRKSKKEREAAIEVHRTCGVNISPEPSFWITITTYGIRFFSFPIPNPFIKAKKLVKKKRVTLQDENGHMWTMGLVHTTRNRVLFANSDWKSFCCGNNIKSGDVLEFRAANDPEENVTLHVKKLDGPPDSGLTRSH